MKRWAKRVVVVLALAWAGFILGWAPYFLAGIVTTRRFQFPDKENAGLTPESFKLPFEEVAFTSSDGVPLKGWWVPSPDGSAKGSVILVHGLNRSRIEMVKKTPFVAHEGWNALLLDLRHHGASGGDKTTLGAKEKLDVLAAVALARQKSPGPVVLWGVSLGGATATLAAADDKTIGGLVCDSSYRSVVDTLGHHLVLFRNFSWWSRITPRWPVADLALYWFAKRGDFDPYSVDVVAAARKLEGRPAVFVCNSEDRRMPKEIAFDLQAAAGPQAKVLVVPGKSHGGAYRDGTAAYEHAVQELLNEVAAAAGAQRMAAR